MHFLDLRHIKSRVESTMARTVLTARTALFAKATKAMKAMKPKAMKTAAKSAPAMKAMKTMKFKKRDLRLILSVIKSVESSPLFLICNVARRDPRRADWNFDIGIAGWFVCCCASRSASR